MVAAPPLPLSLIVVRPKRDAKEGTSYVTASLLHRSLRLRPILARSLHITTRQPLAMVLALLCWTPRTIAAPKPFRSRFFFLSLVGVKSYWTDSAVSSSLLGSFGGWSCTTEPARNNWTGKARNFAYSVGVLDRGEVADRGVRPVFVVVPTPASSFRLASTKSKNISAFRHSSRCLPLKLSMSPFSVGRPGRPFRRGRADPSRPGDSFGDGQMSVLGAGGPVRDFGAVTLSADDVAAI